MGVMNGNKSLKSSSEPCWSEVHSGESSKGVQLPSWSAKEGGVPNMPMRQWRFTQRRSASQVEEIQESQPGANGPYLAQAGSISCLLISNYFLTLPFMDADTPPTLTFQCWRENLPKKYGSRKVDQLCLLIYWEEARELHLRYQASSDWKTC